MAVMNRSCTFCGEKKYYVLRDGRQQCYRCRRRRYACGSILKPHSLWTAGNLPDAAKRELTMCFVRGVTASRAPEHVCSRTVSAPTCARFYHVIRKALHHATGDLQSLITATGSHGKHRYLRVQCKFESERIVLSPAPLAAAGLPETSISQVRIKMGGGRNSSVSLAW